MCTEFSTSKVKIKVSSERFTVFMKNIILQFGQALYCKINLTDNIIFLAVEFISIKLMNSFVAKVVLQSQTNVLR